MTEFFEAVHPYVIGCDPGPKHSAFALIGTNPGPRLVDLAYVRNRDLSKVADWTHFVRALDDASLNRTFHTLAASAIALEKCGARFGISGNALLFETCMAAGVVRSLADRGPEPGLAFAFAPADWRYVLCGKGGAKDTNVRDILLTVMPDCDRLVKRCSKELKKKMNLTKPITSHLRDAIGVALATGFVKYRTGKPVHDFPMWTEVRCG